MICWRSQALAGGEAALRTGTCAASASPCSRASRHRRSRVRWRPERAGSWASNATLLRAIRQGLARFPAWAPAEKREENLGRERFAAWDLSSTARRFSAPPPSIATGDETPLGKARPRARPAPTSAWREPPQRQESRVHSPGYEDRQAQGARPSSHAQRRPTSCFAAPKICADCGG